MYQVPEGHLQYCLIPSGDILVSNLASLPALVEVKSVTAASSQCLGAAAGAGMLLSLPCFA